MVAPLLSGRRDQGHHPRSLLGYEPPTHISSIFSFW
jgi:hypothetical protein